MDGLLLINKPQGVSSTKLGTKLKKVLNIKKVGHAGTLDLEASGLLLLLLGSACRLQDYLLSFKKEYKGLIRFGVETNTDDIFGEVLSKSDTSLLSSKDKMLEIEDLVKTKFSGSMLQVAPKVSAKKTAGISDYKRIRRGEEVVEKSKNIWVEVLDFKFISQDLAQYHVNVSSGFYVRSFARDIGKLIGISAVTESICRTSVGPFKIENAYDPAYDSVSNPREFLDIDNYDAQEFKNSIISKILSIEEVCSSLNFERIEIIDEILIKQFQNGNPEAIKSLNLKSNAAIIFGKEKPLAIIKNNAGECSYSLVFS